MLFLIWRVTNIAHFQTAFVQTKAVTYDVSCIILNILDEI